MLADGSPDSADQECWDLADAIYAMWGVDDSIWGRIFRGVDRDYFMQHIATLQATDRNWMQRQHQTWDSIHRQDRELQLTVIPDEVNNPELRMPGDTIVKAAVVDTAQCVNDFPLGCGALASDVSLTVATGAVVLCAGLTGGGCLATGGAIGTLAGVGGSAVTTVNAVTGERGATYGDAAVSWTTTVTGSRFGGRQNGLVGAAISLFQRMYDSWSSNR